MYCPIQDGTWNFKLQKYIQCSELEASATSAAIECDNSQRAIAGISKLNQVSTCQVGTVQLKSLAYFMLRELGSF